MLTFDLDIGVRIVGEPLEQDRKLFSRKRAKLYMVVPKLWPIPDGYAERLMPEGTLGITDENVLSLDGEYRIRREGIISEDWQKASRQIDWFYISGIACFYLGRKNKVHLETAKRRLEEEVEMIQDLIQNIDSYLS